MKTIGFNVFIRSLYWQLIKFAHYTNSCFHCISTLERFGLNGLNSWDQFVIGNCKVIRLYLPLNSWEFIFRLVNDNKWRHYFFTKKVRLFTLYRSEASTLRYRTDYNGARADWKFFDFSVERSGIFFDNYVEFCALKCHIRPFLWQLQRLVQ